MPLYHLVPPNLPPHHLVEPQAISVQTHSVYKRLRSVISQKTAGTVEMRRTADHVTLNLGISVVSLILALEGESSIESIKSARNSNLCIIYMLIVCLHARTLSCLFFLYVIAHHLEIILNTWLLSLARKHSLVIQSCLFSRVTITIHVGMVAELHYPKYPIKMKFCFSC